MKLLHAEMSIMISESSHNLSLRVTECNVQPLSGSTGFSLCDFISLGQGDMPPERQRKNDALRLTA